MQGIGSRTGMMLGRGARIVGFAALALTGAAVAQPAAKVAEGGLRGIARGSVDAFLGVPFAAPPTSDRRWRAPAPAAAWTGTRSAEAYAPSCQQFIAPQGFGPWTSEYVVQGEVSEDCLYLNVWAPAARARKRPVLVWIHGGAFMSGSGSVPIYDGEALARKGIVVVTINYRIGGLGFLAHPELTREADGSGNFGLLDQIAALRWVRENIAAFGGDPDQVTIAGQSAGAMSVLYLMEAPAARGLFARAIAQSGAGLTLPPPTLAEAEEKGIAFQHAMGAGTLAELRALPAAKVAAYMPQPGPGGVPALPFVPVRDGRVMPATPAPLVPMPVITGLTADEPSGFDPLYGKVGQAAFRARLAAQFGDAGGLAEAYPAATDAEAARRAVELSRDVGVAATLEWAERRASSGAAPAFIYLYDHAEPGPGAERFRAFHSAEIPYVFQTLGKAQRPFTSQDFAVSDRMSSYWLNFVLRGDPNGPGLPFWPRYAIGEDRVMRLGAEPGSVSLGAEKMSLFRRLRAAGARLSIF